jgi:TRAP-type C4-dicarboxylate transport system permease large subunit
LPFMACAMILLIILIIFPEITLWLPNFSKSF